MNMLLEWIRRPDVDGDHRASAATLLRGLLEVKQSDEARRRRRKAEMAGKLELAAS